MRSYFSNDDGEISAEFMNKDATPDKLMLAAA